jgi:hypothetical protein
MQIPQRVYDRLQAKAHREPCTKAPGDCLISDYSAGSHGYAQIGWTEEGKSIVTVAHLAIWRYHNGEPPEGQTVDHICRRKKCIEPRHFRLIPNFENARRTNGRDWPMGQCVNGHGNEHLRSINGGRKLACSICKSDWNRRYNQKRRAKP